MGCLTRESQYRYRWNMKRSFELDSLIQEARGGQVAAEEALLSHLRVRFVTIAKYYVGEAYAEDVAQDACIIVLRKYRELAEDANFDAWAFRVLKNTIGNHLRRTVVRKRYVDRSIDIEHLAETRVNREADDTLGRLQHHLVRMRETHPRQAEVLLLVLRGYSTEEICRECNVSRGNLYVMLHRARKWLADCLKAEDSK